MGRRGQFGGGLLCLGGGIIAYVPLVLLPTTGMSLGAIGGQFRMLGAACGLAVVACGVVTLLRREYTLRASIAGIVFALLSFLGAFGGFVIGAAIAVVGGALCLSASLQTEGEPERKPLFTTDEDAAETETEPNPFFDDDENSPEAKTETNPFFDSDEDASGAESETETEAETETEPVGDTLFGTDGES